MLHDVLDALRRHSPDALELARAAALAEPQNPDAQHLLGIAQRDAGDLDAASASFDRAIALVPEESLYHFSRGLVAYTQRDFATASAASERAVAFDPNQLGAYLLRIQLALASGDHAEADRQLKLAERVDPEHPQLLVAAGQIAVLQGDRERALKLLAAGAQALPNDVQALTTLGMAYLRFGHYSFAEQSLRSAMEADPDASRLRRVLVESLIGQERFDEAARELATYQQQHPQDHASRIVGGELQLRANDARSALESFRAALMQSPRNLRAFVGAQRALEMLGDRALARAFWDEMLKHDSQFDPIWASRLVMHEEEEDGREVLRRWREAMPDSAAAFLNQARQDEVDGRDAEAEAGYDAVLARAPSQVDARFGKAAYELRRDPALAIPRLDAMIAQVPPPQAKAALSWRGQAHDALQQPHEAVADWQQAHAGLGLLPPARPLPADTLQSVIANAPPPTAPVEHAPVLLWGPPGSGSERIAATLLFAPGRPLLQTTTAFLPREMELRGDFLQRAQSAETLPGAATEVGEAYVRLIEPLIRQGNQGVFDWIATLDARLVPVLQHALPGTRLLAVLRDPRDMLLNWLAFGAPAGPSFGVASACAHWLASQLEHLLFIRDVLKLPTHIIDMDRFDSAPTAELKAIATFSDLPTAPSAEPALKQRTGPGGLPTLLPAGRWRVYRNELDEAFAVLAPVAERLGYHDEDSLL
jgi:tetratricopeptide (TPR) repeat protein